MEILGRIMQVGEAHLQPPRTSAPNPLRVDLDYRPPARDNLERALIAAGADPDRPDPGGEPPSEEVSARDALAEGVALVYRERGAALERSGGVAFDPVGERFDPAEHEAVATGEADGVASGTVLETLERGYRVDSQVIRPARVVVSG